MGLTGVVAGEYPSECTRSVPSHPTRRLRPRAQKILRRDLQCLRHRLIPPAGRHPRARAQGPRLRRHARRLLERGCDHVRDDLVRPTFPSSIPLENITTARGCLQRTPPVRLWEDHGRRGREPAAAAEHLGREDVAQLHPQRPPRAPAHRRGGGRVPARYVGHSGRRYGPAPSLTAHPSFIASH